MTPAEYRFRLADFGHDLLTRDRAATIREKLRSLIASLSPGARVLVDMDGVGAITPSFADELLGRLLLEVGPAQFRSALRLQAADETVRLLVNRVLAQRAAECGVVRRR